MHICVCIYIYIYIERERDVYIMQGSAKYEHEWTIMSMIEH